MSERMECLVLEGTWRPTSSDAHDMAIGSVGFLTTPDSTQLAAAAIEVMRQIRHEAGGNYLGYYMWEGRIEWWFGTGDLWDLLPPTPPAPQSLRRFDSTRRGPDPVMAGVVGFLIGAGVSS